MGGIGMLGQMWATFSRTFEISYFIQHFSIVVSTLIVGLESKRYRHPVLAFMWRLLVFLPLLMLIGTCIITFAPLLFDPLWDGVQIAFAALVLFRCNTYRTRTRLTLLFIQVTSMIAVMQIINEASMTAGSFGASDGMLWALRSFSSVLQIPCALLIRRWNIDKYDRVQLSTMSLSGVIMCIVLLLHEWVYFYYRGDTRSVRLEPYVTFPLLFAFLSLLIINMIDCYSLYRTCALQTQITELQADVLDRKRVEELIALSEKNVQTMREARHDIKNQFAYLTALADKGSLAEVQTYLHELSFDFLRPLKAIDCGNANMNAILNMELAKAEKRGIELDMQVVVPQALPFQWSDLCSLVTNLIDNAIEGCVQLPGGEGVKVRMVMQGEELFLSVTNPTDKVPAFLTEMRTTKANQEAHGFGTHIIRKIVEKYNGYCDYSIADGRFCVSCMLNS